MEIISEEITYKDKNFDIKLKPIFQTIAENQYNWEQKNANNRTSEIGIKKGLETNSCPNNRKKTPQVGLEPTAYRLTAGCSAIELLRNIFFALFELM